MKLPDKLKDLQYEYKTIKSEMMFRSRESELVKAAEPIGLQSDSIPPMRIKIDAPRPINIKVEINTRKGNSGGKKRHTVAGVPGLYFNGHWWDYNICKGSLYTTGEGNYWRGMSDSLHQRIVELDAERGTIYSEDGSMLSTSIPQFDIYIDFMADGLREKNGKRFKENLDSLSYSLARLFGDRSTGEYKQILAERISGKGPLLLTEKEIVV